jgi:hypothetical protein
MKHVLDNPAFNALSTGNKNSANGNGHIKYFDEEVSPFIGFDENTDDNFDELYQLINHDWPVAFVSPNEAVIPKPWETVFYVMCFQMIYKGDVQPVDENHLVV